MPRQIEAKGKRAQVELGELYEKGQGVVQDYTEAMAWYRKAAEQGNTRAQYKLATLYEIGQGVTRDHRDYT